MNNDYKICGETTIIFVNYKGNKAEVLIDTEDLPKLDAYPYSLFIAAHGKRNYANFQIEFPRVNGKRIRKRIPLHRIIMDFPKGLDVDHINKNSLNNKKSNLRAITKADHRQNQTTRVDNKLGVRGVDKIRNYYRVQVSYKGKKIIEFYNTLEEAREAAIKHRKTHMPFYFEGEEENEYLFNK